MKIRVDTEVVARTASAEPHPLWEASFKIITKMLEPNETVIESKYIDFLSGIWGYGEEVSVGLFRCGFISSDGKDQYAAAMRFAEPILRKPNARIITWNSAYMYGHGKTSDLAKSFADYMMTSTETDKGHRDYALRKIKDALDRITRTGR